MIGDVTSLKLPSLTEFITPIPVHTRPDIPYLDVQNVCPEKHDFSEERDHYIGHRPSHLSKPDCGNQF
jgi:hypothetical protein